MKVKTSITLCIAVITTLLSCEAPRKDHHSMPSVTETNKHKENQPQRPAPFENFFFLDASQSDSSFWLFKYLLDSAFKTNDTILLFSLIDDSLEGVISNQPYKNISKYNFNSYGLKADGTYYSAMEFFRKHLQYGFMPLRAVDSVYVRFPYNILKKYDTIPAYKNYPFKKTAFPEKSGYFQDNFPFILAKDSVNIYKSNSKDADVVAIKGNCIACSSDNPQCGGNMLNYSSNKKQGSSWYYIFCDDAEGFVNSDDVITYLDYLTIIIVSKTNDGWKIKSINKAPGC